MSSSLKKLAVQGAVWTTLGYGAGQLLRLVSNLILTRLLMPEIFGLMALVSVFITGLYLFSDIGVLPSIIRHERGDDPKFLNTAWTVQAIRGITLWICSLIIAFPVAHFFEEPQLSKLIPVVGLSAVISGFNSTSLATLNRHMAIKKLSIFEFFSQLISLIFTIALAYFIRTVWALVAGNLISTAITMIGSHFLIPGQRNRFAWDKETLTELFTFGRWIFISTIMSFLAGQTDRLMLGKLLPIEVLGIYTIAFTFADIQRSIIQRINSKVLFPAISKRVAELPRATLREKLLEKRRIILLGLVAIITCFFNFGDLLIYVLYDQRYQDAGWMLPILAVGLWPLLLHITINPVLYAIGKPLYVALGNFFKFLYMLTVVPFSYFHMGIFGVILAIAFNDLPSYVVINYGLWREKFSSFKQDFLATILMIASVGLVAAARYMLGFGFSLSGFFN